MPEVYKLLSTTRNNLMIKSLFKFYNNVITLQILGKLCNFNIKKQVLCDTFYC